MDAILFLCLLLNGEQDVAGRRAVNVSTNRAMNCACTAATSKQHVILECSGDELFFNGLHRHNFSNHAYSERQNNQWRLSRKFQRPHDAITSVPSTKEQPKSAFPLQ